MQIRKSDVFIFFLALNVCVMSALFWDSLQRQEARREVLERNREMVRVLELTDLSLFTDARYTRHPSMADFNSPFQDHPMAFEHFPSGSVMAVPPHLKPKTR